MENNLNDLFTLLIIIFLIRGWFEYFNIRIDEKIKRYKVEIKAIKWFNNNQDLISDLLDSELNLLGITKEKDK